MRRRLQFLNPKSIDQEAISSFYYNPWSIKSPGIMVRPTDWNLNRLRKLNSAAACNCSSAHDPSCPQFLRPRIFHAKYDLFEQWEGPIVDSFGNHLSETQDDIRKQAFSVFDECRNLDFLISTKFPQNIRAMWPKDGKSRTNIWLLCVAEDQASVDERIPHLLSCRSLVPLIGAHLVIMSPIDLRRVGKTKRGDDFDVMTGTRTKYQYKAKNSQDRSVIARDMKYPGLDWVILSGHTCLAGVAEPCDISWIRSVLTQRCDVPCYVKNLGGNCLSSRQGWPEGTRFKDGRVLLRDRGGADPSEWPLDVRVRLFPSRLSEGGIL